MNINAKPNKKFYNLRNKFEEKINISDPKFIVIQVELNKNNSVEKKILIGLNTVEGHEYSEDFDKEKYLSTTIEKNSYNISFKLISNNEKELKIIDIMHSYTTKYNTFEIIISNKKNKSKNGRY